MNYNNKTTLIWLVPKKNYFHLWGIDTGLLWVSAGVWH